MTAMSNNEHQPDPELWGVKGGPMNIGAIKKQLCDIGF
jgi:hypothetical protein